MLDKGKRKVDEEKDNDFHQENNDVEEDDVVNPDAPSTSNMGTMWLTPMADYAAEVEEKAKKREALQIEKIKTLVTDFPEDMDILESGVGVLRDIAYLLDKELILSRGLLAYLDRRYNELIRKGRGQLADLLKPLIKERTEQVSHMFASSKIYNPRMFHPWPALLYFHFPRNIAQLVKKVPPSLFKLKLYDCAIRGMLEDRVRPQRIEVWKRRVLLEFMSATPDSMSATPDVHWRQGNSVDQLLLRTIMGRKVVMWADYLPRSSFVCIMDANHNTEWCFRPTSTKAIPMLQIPNFNTFARTVVGHRLVILVGETHPGRASQGHWTYLRAVFDERNESWSLLRPHRQYPELRGDRLLCFSWKGRYYSATFQDGWEILLELSSLFYYDFEEMVWVYHRRGDHMLSEFQRLFQALEIASVGNVTIVTSRDDSLYLIHHAATTLKEHCIYSMPQSGGRWIPIRFHPRSNSLEHFLLPNADRQSLRSLFCSPVGSDMIMLSQRLMDEEGIVVRWWIINRQGLISYNIIHIPETDDNFYLVALVES